MSRDRDEPQHDAHVVAFSGFVMGQPAVIEACHRLRDTPSERLRVLIDGGILDEASSLAAAMLISRREHLGREHQPGASPHRR